MAKRGLFKSTGISMRVSGQPRYIIGQNGASNRLELSAHINQDYIDRESGQVVEKNSIVSITVWNGKSNYTPGKGFADNIAKMLSVGKEFSGEFVVNTYEGAVYNNLGAKALNPDGSEIKTRRTSFVLQPGTFVPGNDAQKQIDSEVGNYASHASAPGFLARPPQWNVPGTTDNTTWLNGVLPARTASVYQGGDTYGYAKVIGGSAGSGHSAGSPSGPGGASINRLAMVADPATGKSYNYDQYLVAGWTEAAMRADVRFAPFFVAAAGTTGPSGPQSQGAGGVI